MQLQVPLILYFVVFWGMCPSKISGCVQFGYCPLAVGGSHDVDTPDRVKAGKSVRLKFIEISFPHKIALPHCMIVNNFTTHVHWVC